MKLKLSDIDNVKVFNIKIKGDEDWLVDIYKNIDPSYGDKKEETNSTNIEADIDIIKTILKDRYEIKGSLKLSTELECGRCCKKLKWNTSKKFQNYFINTKQDFIKDRDLKASELDEYYPDKIGELDLEIIINDLVLEAIPDNIGNQIEHECINAESSSDDGYSQKIYSVGKNLSAFKDLDKMINEFRDKKDKIKD